MKKKTVASTAVENHTHKVFPSDLNTNGTVFGGLIMGIADKIALVVAERHAGCHCTTASVDALHFLAPSHLGEVLIFKASINRAWNASMEIGVKVISESLQTSKRVHVVSAYFTFVALDPKQQPTAVPPVITETPLQQRRFEEADLRREQRLFMAKEIKKRRSR